MCGVIGIIGPEEIGGRGVSCAAAYDAYRGLLALQHRGQDAAGILSYDNVSRMFAMEKDLGLVANVFSQQKIEKLNGYMAIGHTRYATAGSDGKRDIQPMVEGIPFGLGMVHNGNTLNYYSLKNQLSDDFRRQLLTGNDLEVLIHYFGHFLMNGQPMPTESTFSFENIKQAAGQMFDTVIGGYAVLGLMAGQGLVAFRDPKGIRPLALGVRENEDGTKVWILASETIAMTYLGYKYLRDVEPGEVIYIDTKGNFQSAIVRKDPERAQCFFEWVYFSGAESAIDHHPVYGVRLKFGERLGMKARAAIEAAEICPDVVMPVPDTSRTAAISVADSLKLPYREGLIKNRYVARSFILSNQDKRDHAVELKLSPIVGEIEGKSIFLVDDSIVRGTTSKRIVSLLKKYGAKEVTLGITCPPIRHPCFYGIDFPDSADLLAHDKTAEQLAEFIGVKKVIYLDEEDMRAAIGIQKLCMACVDKKYPTAVAEGELYSRERKKARAAS
ncbi:MAG: amidophosphoribosyltransferase [Micavibrio sp.]|nr:amidophosphoribosyltransferase [Micavibrio sp.]